MARRREDSDWSAEAVFSVLEWLVPDELWLLAVPIGIVFGLIWLLGWVFRSAFGE